MVVAEVKVNIAQAAYLNCGPRNIFAKLQKQVCCKFAIQQVNWNEFKIVLNGTAVGIEKGRALLKKELESRFHLERRNQAKSTQEFSLFSALPSEIKQMVIDRVQCDEPMTSKSDGRGLMNLRAASKELKTLADRTLQRERKCFKERIYIAETYKSGQVRLGTPPLQSKIVVTLNELDQLLEKMCLVKSREVHIRCEFRKEWCDSVVKLLIKNPHIKPKTLKIYGLAGSNVSSLHQYVQSTPSLEQLMFEKSPNSNALSKERFMQYCSRHFFNLGPQDSLPENVRNSYNSRVVFTRQPITGEEEHMRMPAELKF